MLGIFTRWGTHRSDPFSLCGRMSRIPGLARKLSRASGRASVSTQGPAFSTGSGPRNLTNIYWHLLCVRHVAASPSLKPKNSKPSVLHPPGYCPLHPFSTSTLNMTDTPSPFSLLSFAPSPSLPSLPSSLRKPCSPGHQGAPLGNSRYTHVLITRSLSTIQKTIPWGDVPPAVQPLLRLPLPPPLPRLSVSGPQDLCQDHLCSVHLLFSPAALIPLTQYMLLCAECVPGTGQRAENRTESFCPHRADTLLLFFNFLLLSEFITFIVVQ